MARSHMKWLAGVVAGATVVLLICSRHGGPRVRPTAIPTMWRKGCACIRTKGDCQSCHGWAADGRKMDTQMPDGANLRTTRLDRELLIDDHQVRQAREGDAGLRPARLQRRPLLQHEGGRPEEQESADARPAGDAAGARDRAHRSTFFRRRSSARARWTSAKCVEYWGSDVEVCKELQ